MVEISNVFDYFLEAQNSAAAKFHALKTKSPPQAARVLQKGAKINDSCRRLLQRSRRLQNGTSSSSLASAAQLQDSSSSLTSFSRQGGRLNHPPFFHNFQLKIKFREKTFPRLRQTGEGFSLNSISLRRKDLIFDGLISRPKMLPYGRVLGELHSPQN